MKKNYIQHVILHTPENRNADTLSDKVTNFHLAVIEQRLNASQLSKEEKTAVIDKIIEDLRKRETDGIIR